VRGVVHREEDAYELEFEDRAQSDERVGVEASRASWIEASSSCWACITGKACPEKRFSTVAGYRSPIARPAKMLA
jgi:hypothetical protein